MDDFRHVCGFAVDGNLTWPRQGGAATFARRGERPPVFGHFLIAEGSEYGTRQDPFDEDVVGQHHLFAGRRTKALEDSSRIRRPLLPSERPHQRFHVADAGHGTGMAIRPIETERRTPVMHHHDDVVRHAQRLQRRVQIGAMFNERVAVGVCVRQLVRIAHADQIDGDATSVVGGVGQDVPPEIARRGIAVQKDDGVAAADFHIGHLQAVGSDLALFQEALFRCAWAAHCESILGAPPALVGWRVG